MPGSQTFYAHLHKTPKFSIYTPSALYVHLLRVLPTPPPRSTYTTSAFYLHIFRVLRTPPGLVQVRVTWSSAINLFFESSFSFLLRLCTPSARRAMIYPFCVRCQIQNRENPLWLFLRTTSSIFQSV